MTKIKLGNVTLDAVIQELPSTQADITDKPVEKGSDVSDHIRVQPTTIELSGTMVEDASSKLQTLKAYQREGKLLKYIGRNAYDNMVIETLDTDHAVDAEGGYHYNITIRQIRVAKPKTFQATVRNPKTKRQDKKTATKVKKKTNVGRQQPRPKQSYPNNKKSTKNKRGKKHTKGSFKKYEYTRLISPPGSWKINQIN